MTSVHPSQLLEFLGASRAAEFGSDRVEVRSLSFIVFALFFYQLAEPGFYITFVRESLFYRVASLNNLNHVLGTAFFVAACMILPHLVNLVFFPKQLARKLPRKIAAFAAMGGAVIWGFLGYKAWPLDYEWLSVVCLLRASIDLWLGVLLGLSVNAQQARDAHEAAQAQIEKEAVQ
ncbi:hypothetical protein ZHS_34 [Edwardsiella phage vB_EpM_ZHS]|jgi:hypothetical protein|nr:hypothetical protein ZHS_34 [Edwardsiella phage vB_EpM_ZHS]